MNPLTLLLKTTQESSLSHAYLLYGNATEEKTKAVLALAKRLLPGQKPRNHADMLWVKAPLMSEIQEILRFSSLTPLAGSRRMIVIEQAEDMGHDVQAALLKLLEEPSPSTLFLLLAHPAALLISPLRSRMQEIPFFSFIPFQTEEKLAAAAELSRLSKGSLGSRLAYAKEKGEDGEGCRIALEAWMERIHALFLDQRKEGDLPLSSAAKLLELMQETWFILRTTNVNPRMAIEHVLLAL